MAVTDSKLWTKLSVCLWVYSGLEFSTTLTTEMPDLGTPWHFAGSQLVHLDNRHYLCVLFHRIDSGCKWIMPVRDVVLMYKRNSLVFPPNHATGGTADRKWKKLQKFQKIKSFGQMKALCKYFVNMLLLEFLNCLFSVFMNLQTAPGLVGLSM